MKSSDKGLIKISKYLRRNWRDIILTNCHLSQHQRLPSFDEICTWVNSTKQSTTGDKENGFDITSDDEQYYQPAPRPVKKSRKKKATSILSKPVIHIPEEEPESIHEEVPKEVDEEQKDRYRQLARDIINEYSEQYEHLRDIDNCPKLIDYIVDTTPMKVWHAPPIDEILLCSRKYILPKLEKHLQHEKFITNHLYFKLRSMHRTFLRQVMPNLQLVVKQIRMEWKSRTEMPLNDKIKYHISKRLGNDQVLQ
ncbi:unnamed protein product [Didymodactylos carnosus]|uniref:Uncharacterized protein n=1 Tax=Didymodactylos carnosus TaxID=1234261 RepID=A0A815PLX6_9BILA|nr:unnamed protein product [Didymodactylos carnosus]CAF1450780.1 unnamed protein product [Didymodactylos carnosus]CAF3996051.1 unnamed protein product [Didymodactylos carnosus]CAF4324195.1 unnamed protein product [Didymodactylos carnosus]